MRTAMEIKKKINDLETELKSIHSDSYETEVFAQVQILKWVLGM